MGRENEIYTEWNFETVNTPLVQEKGAMKYIQNGILRTRTSSDREKQKA